MRKRYILAITGASGPVLGVRLLQSIARHAEVHLVMSSMALEILRDESGIDWTAVNVQDTEKKIRRALKHKGIHCYHEHDLAAPISSGSFRTDGMFVVPCSMKTLAGIAVGYTENLVQRAADVTIKEGRLLVLAPREMPLSPIHLENMLKLSRIGVRILPPLLSFYNKPETVDDMVNFVVGKILDTAGIANDLFPRWTGR